MRSIRGWLLLCGLMIATVVALVGLEPTPVRGVSEAETTGAAEAAVRFVVATDGPLPAGLDAECRDEALGLYVLRARPSALAEQLDGLEGVRYWAPDPVLFVAGSCCGFAEGNFRAGLDEALAAERVDLSAWLGRAGGETRGEGVTVAVLDTGLDREHPDLSGSILTPIDVRGEGVRVDANGHGTAMASLVAAHNHDGLLGVAPRATLLPVLVADRAGRARASDVASGIRRAVDAGARVVLLAMGTRNDARVLREAAAYAEQNGALLVAAGGNENPGQLLFPAALPGVLAVGSADLAGALSNRTVISPGVDLYAPGEDALVALPGGLRGRVGGTSVAAARVAGLAALLLARNADLSPAALRGLLLGSSGPVADLAGLEELLPAGLCAPERAWDRALPETRSARVELVRSLPRRPVDGAAAQLRARVRNGGTVPLTGLEVVFRLESAIVGRAPLPPLAPGEALEVVTSGTLAWTEGVVLSAAIDGLPGAEAARTELRFADLPRPDLSVRGLRLQAEGDSVRLVAAVENLGAHTAALDGARFSLAGATRAIDGARLAPGEATELSCLFPRPADDDQLPAQVVLPSAGELDGFDNTWQSTLFLTGATAPLRGQYQQSNGVDFILDAPWRVNPNVAYVPLLAYAASRGSTDSSLRLAIDGLTVTVKDQPGSGAAGVVAYACDRSTASVAPTGLEIVDELGIPTGSDVAFEGTQWTVNGRYRLLKLPVAALPATRPATVYLDTLVEWETERPIIWSFSHKSTGKHRKVLKVTLADEDLPRLPGEGHYYDVHYHSESEWHFGDTFDILAPRKAYGGPHLMFRESAYALGLIDDPSDVFEKLCTTDHNCFYNEAGGNPDDPDYRPPYGFIAPDGSGRSEFEQARQQYGRTAGEEIAVSHSNLFSGLLPVPLGAHMLLYQASHIEGPWHGGSSLSQQFNAGDPLVLESLLVELAQRERSEHQHAFAYSAHAFGGSFDWGDTKRHRALALSAAPSDEFAHVEGTGFVFKGHQLWNGRGPRSLATSKIDFEDLNPWTDTDFVDGSESWDGSLYRGLAQYHDDLSELLAFSFDAAPERRFIRKSFILGGSDAHGDFNYGDSRLATLIGIPATFSVDDSAFGKVRSYVLGAGKSGASAADRRLAALASGNAICTDGPLLDVRLDSEVRFDGTSLVWDATATQGADADGRIGGDGTFDGGFTALVPSGARSAFLYRYAESDELGGPVGTIHIYRDDLGAPNPTWDRNGTPVLQSRGRLAPNGAQLALQEALDPVEEGVVDGLCAFSFGAFTQGDPDLGTLPVDATRCFTNPVWAAPVTVTVTAVAPVSGKIPAGGLTVELDFPISMGAPLALELKALDTAGVSTDAAGAALSTLSGSWSTAAGVEHGRFTATNDQELPLNLDRWPDPQTVTFVVYTRDTPDDTFGNPLHRFAFTFEQPGIGTGGGTGVGGSTAGSPSTGPGPTASSGGSGGGGGGCAVTTRPAAPLFALIALALLVWASSQLRPKSAMSLLR